MSKFGPGPLKKYVDEHPHAQFIISTDMLGPCIIRTTKTFSGGYINGEEVAHYSRERDCKRALKEAGFVQQGRVWTAEKRAKEIAAYEEAEAEKEQ